MYRHQETNNSIIWLVASVVLLTLTIVVTGTMHEYHTGLDNNTTITK